MFRAGLSASVVVGVFVAAAPAASDSGTRVIDRTLLCQMPGEGYPDSTRFMAVSALAGNRRRDAPPIISANNGPSLEVRATVTTRRSGRLATGAVVINREQCAATSDRVRLSVRGLKRARSAPRSSYRCDVPRTVLIRVRAMFKRPTGFAADERFGPSVLFAKGPIATAYLAVTTVRRKPLAFASVNDASGRARLFVELSRCRAEG
jgi:hypothetical protein